MGRCSKPVLFHQYPRLGQEATDNRQAQVWETLSRPNEENFSFEGGWILEQVAENDRGLSISGDPWNLTSKDLKQPPLTGLALTRKLGSQGLQRSLQPLCSYDSMKVNFECTTRQILSFFHSNNIIIFICTDLPGSLKTGQSFWSILREVPNRVSFILLSLMRRKGILVKSTLPTPPKAMAVRGRYASETLSTE